MTEVRQFRDVMGRFATGVAVITGVAPDGTPFGFTANALTSVSLEPLLVLVCVGRDSSSLPALREAGRFGVSVLARGDERLARRFASEEPNLRFKGIDLRSDPAASHPPILQRALAWLDCDLWREIDAGDHVVVFGEVRACGERPDLEPLVFFGGNYGTMRP